MESRTRDEHILVLAACVQFNLLLATQNGDSNQSFMRLMKSLLN